MSILVRGFPSQPRLTTGYMSIYCHICPHIGRVPRGFSWCFLRSIWLGEKKAKGLANTTKETILLRVCDGLCTDWFSSDTSHHIASSAAWSSHAASSTSDFSHWSHHWDHEPSIAGMMGRYVTPLIPGVPATIDTWITSSQYQAAGPILISL